MRPNLLNPPMNFVHLSNAPYLALRMNLLFGSDYSLSVWRGLGHCLAGAAIGAIADKWLFSAMGACPVKFRYRV